VVQFSLLLDLYSSPSHRPLPQQPLTPKQTTHLNKMVKAVVAGASGGIGQVSPQESNERPKADCKQASVSPPQGISPHRRARPLRCCQHSRCCGRLVPHLLPRGMLLPAPFTRDYTHQGQTVTGYLPKDDGLKNALTGADVVVIPAGIPRKSALSEGRWAPC
jgi:hypothetical protein